VCNIFSDGFGTRCITEKLINKHSRKENWFTNSSQDNSENEYILSKIVTRMQIGTVMFK
jgi:hypothetical protein